MYIWNHFTVSDDLSQEIRNYYKDSYYLRKQVQRIMYEEDNGFQILKIEDILTKCPLFRAWTIDNRIDLEMAGLLVCSPFYDLGHCHIDECNSGISINFPVSGCGTDDAESDTTFYEPNPDVYNIELDKNNDKRRFINVSENWKEITRYQSIGPTICINTIPHVFRNYGEGIRITMTVRPSPETVPYHLMDGWNHETDEIYWTPGWQSRLAKSQYGYKGP